MAAHIGFRVRPEELVGITVQQVGTLGDLLPTASRPDVPIISWIPQLRDLVSANSPVDEEDGALTFASATGLLIWASNVHRPKYETLEEQNERLASIDRAWLRAKLLDAREKRYAEIKRRPLGISQEGAIVVANFVGWHNEWKAAFVNAFAPYNTDAEALNRLGNQAALVKLRTQTRHDFPGFRQQHFAPFSHLIKHVVKEFAADPDYALQPVYEIKNIPNEMSALRYLLSLAAELKICLGTIGRLSDEECEGYIDLAARRELLRLHEKGRFALIEIVTGARTADSISGGALGYTTVGMPASIRANDWPLYIAMSVRVPVDDRFETHFRAPSSCRLTLVHELSHLLDPAGPREDAHDATFYRTFRFLVDVAIKSGTFPNVVSKFFQHRAADGWSDQRMLDGLKEYFHTLHDLTGAEADRELYGPDHETDS